MIDVAGTRRFRRVADVCFLALIIAIASAGNLAGQCTDSTDWVYGYVGASRLNGNAVRLYADTELYGNHRYWWITYIQTWFYFNQGLAGSQPLGTNGVYGATNWQSYTPTLQVYGPGAYGILGFHAVYTPWCGGIWSPPYLNGWDGYDPGAVISIARPARPDYALGYPRALWYLGAYGGQQILLDGAYQAQTVFTPGDPNGAPESPVYIVVAGPLSLSCTNCTNPTATATAASGGCQVYDVVVQTSYNGFLSEYFWLFINRPWNLVAYEPWVRSEAKDNGYITYFQYTTRGMCATDPPMRDYHINEQFGGSLQPDYVGTNWPTTPEARSLYIPPNFESWADQVSISNPAALPGDPAMCSGFLCIPQFTIPGGGPHILVQHVRQNWFAGAPVSGAGLRVQSNTAQLYTDSGWHTDIVTPNP